VRRRNTPYKCKVCKYKWLGFDTPPKKCPNYDCQSVHWQTGKKVRVKKNDYLHLTSNVWKKRKEEKNEAIVARVEKLPGNF
jgi:hypothetical protein